MNQTLTNCQFAICVNNNNSEDLQIWKLYRIIPDPLAEVEEYLRLVDDSGEDYLYPKNRFVIVEFSELVAQKLLTATF